MSIFIIGKKLGKGSFGSVYEAEDENGKKYAVKSIDTKGFNYIMEASIVTTYKHPGLVSCADIFIESGKLYIVQEKAIGDLMMLSRNNPIQLNKARKYIYSVAKAIDFLHSRNIIHGDIKASNIFLYEDDTVKLGDFSVSLLSLREKYNHKISTPSHNPPECFNKESWSFPIDMWCFGCTIYEIIYGMNIFPNQKESLDFDKLDILKLCIFNWISENENMSITIDIDTDVEGEIMIKKVKHPQLFYKKPYKPINNLIMNLLKCDPSKRFTSKQTLDNDFFISEGGEDTEIIIPECKKYELRSEDVIKLNEYKMVEPIIMETASKILSLCTKEFRDQNKSNINEMCITTSYIINRVKLPDKFKKYDPEKLMVYLGYSIHEYI